MKHINLKKLLLPNVPYVFIGLYATRAGMIEKLISAGFLERKRAKKAVHLIPTSTGVSLITVLPEQLQSPLLTAEWEYRLGQVERGELSPQAFLDGITQMVQELIRTYQVIPGAEVLFPSGRQVVGTCPAAEAPLRRAKRDSSVSGTNAALACGGTTNS